MIAFEVKDMTCGHCVSAITKAVETIDSNAKVEIDLGRHLVRIQPGGADRQQLSDAIQEAGYTPVAVQAAAVPDTPPARGGCCA